jgi:hypothetical protein
MHWLLHLPLLALLLALPSPGFAGAGGTPLDRPDLLAYSSSAPRSSGVFSESNASLGVAFGGNLSAVRNVPAATTGGGTVEVLLGFSLMGTAGGVGGAGDGVNLMFTLDEPDSFSRTSKKVAIQQKAWLTMSAQGVVGGEAFATEAVSIEDCSAKASLKDKSGNRSADQASLKVKCKSIEGLLSQLGLSGAEAQAIRDVFGTKKVSISAKDQDGPEVRQNAR